jgi:hypothetical protein
MAKIETEEDLQNLIEKARTNLKKTRSDLKSMMKRDV